MRKVQNGNDDVEEHPKLLRVWELFKIGNFNVDSWNKIFENPSNEDLATVAVVCREFRTMAENIFAKRLKDGVPLNVVYAKKEWKPVICRFRNAITNVTIWGSIVQQEDFSYFARFLSKTLKVVRFYRISTTQWLNIKFLSQFQHLEKLSFFESVVSLVSPFY